MGVKAIISYSSLKDAASEAKQVARKLNTYADNLNSSVYRKLNNYNGSYTCKIAETKTNVNAKITELRTKSAAYTNYATDLSDLKEKCESTDKAVRTMVSQLTASFKETNGIKNSKVENTINYLLTGLNNSTVAGRWLGNTQDKGASVNDYIMQNFEDWWDYEGGKQVVKGIAVAALEIVGGVCAAVTGILALIAGGPIWALVVAAAGAVAGIIAVVNGIANGVNEARGYNETHNNDNPALGCRRSDEDTVQDALRRETDSEFWHGFATGMDIVDGVCTVISFVDGMGELTKNAYKWTTGSVADVNDLRVKDILTKENFSDFASKLKSTVTTGWDEIGTAYYNAKHNNDFSAIKKIAKGFGNDFLNNLQEFSEGYTNFETFKDGVETVGNWGSLSETLISGGFSLQTIGKDILLDEVVLPNIGLAKLKTYDPSEDKYKDSIISISDITGKVTDIFDIVKGGSDVIENLSGAGDVLNKNLMNKLSQSCDFSIAVPEIKIPTINYGLA